MEKKSRNRVLVIGASGMLGSALFRSFSEEENFETFGTIRDNNNKQFFSKEIQDYLIPNIHLETEIGILKAFLEIRPNIVINCAGIIKQMPSANDHLESLAINAVMPHRLAKFTDLIGARLIHFSTDCVFSGQKGSYVEDDTPDAYDLYGRTKLLGEVKYDHTVTLRTSIIGHETDSAKSLVEWFLSQKGTTKGYQNAIFSGLPTIEVARIVREYVIPNQHLKGVYHLSSSPINKYQLLCLIKKIYNHDIEIIPDNQVQIDRSLKSDRFRNTTGFKPRPWQQMIEIMYTDRISEIADLAE